jgi:hypothetical protein
MVYYEGVLLHLLGHGKGDLLNGRFPAKQQPVPNGMTDYSRVAFLL